MNGKASVHQEMRAIRVAFIKRMGIRSKEMNPNPVGGYKLEHNLCLREAALTEARKLRDEYRDMVKKHGINQYVLDKMDSNLANRDRKTAW